MAKKTESESESPLNGSEHKVTIINKSSFRIGDTSNMTKYEGNGIVKRVKTPVK